MSSAFCWYLTLAFKAFVVLTKVVTDTQIQTQTHTDTDTDTHLHHQHIALSTLKLADSWFALDKRLNFLCVLLIVEVMLHTPIWQMVEANFISGGNSALSCIWYVISAIVGHIGNSTFCQCCILVHTIKWALYSIILCSVWNFYPMLRCIESMQYCITVY